MSKLVWDQAGERLFETGVEKGVIYPQKSDGTYDNGAAWNGLTAVTESPSGAEETKLWANDSKYASLLSAEDIGATLEAYTWPSEFDPCNGIKEIADGVTISQQDRKAFGLCYRTMVGNDTEGNAHGYKLHLLYGAKAKPSEKAYKTVNESPEANTFSWELTTTPVNVTDAKPSALLVVDSLLAGKTKMAALEAILYGTEEAEPRMPLPDEVADIIGTTSQG